jgi:hypothetical protein
MAEDDGARDPRRHGQDSGLYPGLTFRDRVGARPEPAGLVPMLLGGCTGDDETAGVRFQSSDLLGAVATETPCLSRPGERSGSPDSSAQPPH